MDLEPLLCGLTEWKGCKKKKTCPETPGGEKEFYYFGHKI